MYGQGNYATQSGQNANASRPQLQQWPHVPPLLLLLLRPHVHLCCHMVIHQDHPKLDSVSLLHISMPIPVYAILVPLFQFQQVAAILVSFIHCLLLLLLRHHHLHKFMEAPQFCNLTKSLCSIPSGIPVCSRFHLQ